VPSLRARRPRCLPILLIEPGDEDYDEDDEDSCLLNKLISEQFDAKARRHAALGTPPPPWARVLMQTVPAESSASSASSETQQNPGVSIGGDRPPDRPNIVRTSSDPNPEKTGVSDDADDADDRPGTSSRRCPYDPATDPAITAAERAALTAFASAVEGSSWDQVPA
jgi:hypothetical protein